MIYSLKGTLIHTEPTFAVIECGGVGYKCMTTMSTLRQLPKTGEETMLYTLLNVRQDAIDLFGFATQNELNCFKMLTSVSGVGSKVALSILSDASPEKFAFCIASGDAKSLTRSSGVGPKLAQRIVLELKDKIQKTSAIEDVVHVSDLGDAPASSAAEEAISALVVLGYMRYEAANAVAKLDLSQPVEQIIKQALKQLMVQ